MKACTAWDLKFIISLYCRLFGLGFGVWALHKFVDRRFLSCGGDSTRVSRLTEEDFAI